MRPTTWVILVAVCLVTAGIRAQPAAPAKRALVRATDSRFAAGPEMVFDIAIDAKYGATDEDARGIALDDAVVKIDAYLQNHEKPALLWHPDKEYVKNNLILTQIEKDADLDEKTPEIKRVVQLRVGATPEKYRDILLQDKRLRVEQRQWFLARILAVLVASLTAATAILKVGAASKCVTSGWLKAGSVGVLAAAAAGLWLLV
jgi:hypothetical protein